MTFANEGSVFGDVQFGSGNDTLVNPGSIGGTVRTGGGNDIAEISGAIGATLLMGSGEDSVFLAGDIAGRINLGAGNDFFSVATNGNFSGTDYSVARIQGGAGKDTIFGGGRDDVINGGRGDDDLLGHDGNDLITGGQGSDTLRGGLGADWLIGGIGADKLYGGNGEDVLKGGSGRDVLVGGRGDDSLTGGNGADVFLFTGRSGSDTIADMRAEDRVDLALGEPDWTPPIFPFPEDEGGFGIVSPLPPPNYWESLKYYLTQEMNGVRLDLDQFFSGENFNDRTGGGLGQVNEIFFERLTLGDLTEDNFIF
jgi:Ca2+-binding RTX toxin-like protein